MYIDNTPLLPKLLPDSDVTLISAGGEGSGEFTPDWARSLVMLEVHLQTATPGGTLASGVRVLGHCAEMGVNCVWLTPVYEGGNGYGNNGPHTVEPGLTGSAGYKEGWQAVKRWVDEAHKRNIRVLLDIITWGAVTSGALVREHPEWFAGKAWNNEAFDWGNEGFREWYISRAVENIIVTGADGFRVDCEPHYAGYDVFAEIRRRLLRLGRKVLIMSEDGSRHGPAFDIEQDGVLDYNGWDRGAQYADPRKFYLDHLNIVDSVRSGTGIGCPEYQSAGRPGRQRLYTFCVSNHDHRFSAVNSNRLALGYQAILAPFIPLWYLGEEFNLRCDDRVFYTVPVDWSLLEENRAFFEDIKKYVKIRRTYPEIFEYAPEDHRDANICKVGAEGQPLQAYARYAGNRGIIVIGNNAPGGRESFEVTVPFGGMGLDGYGKYALTDLMSGVRVAAGTRADVERFAATVKYQHIGVYLAEGT